MFTRVPGFGTIPIVSHSYGLDHISLQFDVITISVIQEMCHSSPQLTFISMLMDHPETPSDDSCWVNLGFTFSNGAPLRHAEKKHVPHDVWKGLVLPFSLKNGCVRSLMGRINIMVDKILMFAGSAADFILVLVVVTEAVRGLNCHRWLIHILSRTHPISSYIHLPVQTLPTSLAVWILRVYPYIYISTWFMVYMVY